MWQLDSKECAHFQRAYDILIRIPQSNLYTLGLSLFGVAFLYVGKEYVSPLMNKHLPAKVPMPYELLLVSSLSRSLKFFRKITYGDFAKTI